MGATLKPGDRVQVTGESGAISCKCGERGVVVLVTALDAARTLYRVRMDAPCAAYVVCCYGQEIEPER